MVEIVKIRPEHNSELAQIIRTSLEDFDIDLEGTVYVDPYLDDMYTHFTVPNKFYFVAIEDGKVLGGSGIAPLDDIDKNVCELQRMFLNKTARGKGIGAKLMQKCIEGAKTMGFKQCYLETFADMHQAVKLYKRSGFKLIPHSMGSTGHFSCKTWMIREL